MENFNQLGLPESLLNSLTTMKFSKPTEIQAKTIPLALEGKDILGSAQTGTGKTGAFGIPLVAHILKSVDNHALILAPTRELAIQVLTTLKQMLIGSRVKSALLIGGEPIFKQLNQLKAKPQVIVGTPGRINDHLIRKSLDLSKTNFFVLDEFDRMLDMGFSIQLEKIEEQLPKKRQTLMFSATIANNILKLANSYLVDPLRISVGETNTPIEAIKQELIKTSENDKYDILLDKLNQNDGSTIIFVKTKYGTEKLAKRLQDNGHEADAIHGDLRQHKRERVIRAFRDRRNRILVATDVAARGLDINHVECVVNYDLPQCPDDYIHRIGRTGRAGAEGIAISLITSQDSDKWRNISRLINPGEKSSDDRSKSNGKKRSEGSFRGDRKSSRNGSGDKFGAPKKKRFGEKSFSNDKPRSYSSDKPRGFSGDRAKEFFGDKPRGFSGDKSRSYSTDKPRGFSGDRSKEFFGDKPRGFSGDKSRSYSSDKPRGSSSDRSRNNSSDKPRGSSGDKSRNFSKDKQKSFSGNKPRNFSGNKSKKSFNFNNVA